MKSFPLPHSSQYKGLTSLNKMFSLSDLNSNLYVLVLVTPSCLTLCDPMDCSLPGSSVHGILRVSILEWVAIAFSGGSSRPRDWASISCVAGRFFTIWFVLCHFQKWFPPAAGDRLPSRSCPGLALCRHPPHPLRIPLLLEHTLTAEKTETQREEVTCPRHWQSWGPILGLCAPLPAFFLLC